MTGLDAPSRKLPRLLDDGLCTCDGNGKGDRHAIGRSAKPPFNADRCSALDMITR